MADKSNRLRLAVTAAAIILGVIHVFLPDFNVDAVLLALFAFAVVPWLAPLFESLEFPGGWKVEFREFNEAAEKVAKAGLMKIDYPRGGGGVGYLFELVADEDPNLALAGLRMEIERVLAEMALAIGEKDYPKGIYQLMNLLHNRGVLKDEEVTALNEFIPILNKGAHGATIDRSTAEWVLNNGRTLIGSLEERTPGAFPPEQPAGL